jgi:hypothetical protein
MSNRRGLVLSYRNPAYKSYNVRRTGSSITLAYTQNVCVGAQSRLLSLLLYLTLSCRYVHGSDYQPNYQSLYIQGYISAVCRFGEQEVHWVSERTWKFERHFEVTNALLSHHNVDLLLTGLDTVAQVLVRRS